MARSYPIIGQVSSSGGVPATTTNNIYEIVFGSSIQPAGVLGARKLITPTPDDIEWIQDLQAPTTLPLGVAIANNVITNKRFLVWNGIESRIVHDLWVNMHIIAYSFVKIPTTGYDPNNTIGQPEFQSFLVPLAVV